MTEPLDRSDDAAAPGVPLAEDDLAIVEPMAAGADGGTSNMMGATARRR